MYMIISAFSDEISPMLDKQIETLKECSINHIEMRGVNGKNISAYTPSEIKEIKKQIDQDNIKISALGSPIGKIKLTDDFSKELDSLKNLVEIAGILETKYIRMFSFFGAQNERDEVFERLNKYLEVVKDSGVSLLHENEKDIFGDTPERALDISKTLGIKATFDPANYVQCGVDTKVAFEMMKPYIEYMHIKDAIAATGKIVPSGLGDGNLQYILEQLVQMGYKGFLSLEPHLGDFVGFSELEGSGLSISGDAQGGAATFKVAHQALLKILEKI